MTVIEGPTYTIL